MTTYIFRELDGTAFGSVNVEAIVDSSIVKNGRTIVCNTVSGTRFFTPEDKQRIPVMYAELIAMITGEDDAEPEPESTCKYPTKAECYGVTALDIALDACHLSLEEMRPHHKQAISLCMWSTQRAAYRFIIPDKWSDPNGSEIKSFEPRNKAVEHDAYRFTIGTAWFTHPYSVTNVFHDSAVRAEEEANEAEKQPELKLYVWEDVLWDHGPGTAFALAENKVHAATLLNFHPDIMGKEPKEITKPYGLKTYGSM